MSGFVASVIGFSQRNCLFSEGARVLVALSGGPDSCALLLSLVEAAAAGALPRPIGAAHFHHGVRGEDADRDAAFCAQLCTSYSLPCVIGLGAVPSQNGNYSSAMARDMRYAFLEEVAAEMAADVIATAHTADDQAETVLGRVLRGTSLDGLSGIPVMRTLSQQCRVVRPLLSQRRSAIVAYCRAKGITPRHDPSNDRARYTRTRLRRLLPELARDFNPQVYQALNRLAENAEADADLLRTLAAELRQRAVREWGTERIVLDATSLLTAHASLRRRVILSAIRYLAGDRAEEVATAQSVGRVEELLTEPGKRSLPGSLLADCDGTMLWLTRFPLVAPESLPYRFFLPVPGYVTHRNPSFRLVASVPDPGDPVPQQRRGVTVDFAADEEDPGAAPLAVRNTQHGERIRPLGLRGRSRLVRDLLSETGIPEAMRAMYPVIARADNEEILWIPGVCQAESTRVEATTRQRVRLSVDFSPLTGETVGDVGE